MQVHSSYVFKVSWLVSLSDVSVDAMDVSGEQQIDVDHNIFKQRLDSNGELVLATPEKESLSISNEALASLTLFVAVSKPDEMETVKQLIISILNRNFSN